MLEIKDLTISISDRYLIKNLNLILNNGDKLAIIGEEGNGKSTLLKSILYICEYAEIRGNINLKGNRIGYLEQSINTDKLDKSLYEKQDNIFKGIKIIVGIELHTSYIFVEGSSYLYDELMAFTGLDDKDLTNYFLVAQYIKCKEKFNI